ncbi:MAG: cytochrome c biogenesis protein DipZ [Chlamydiales bacterium]
MLLLIFFAFFAGVVTVLSPCVLPVLPAILSVSAGQGKARPLGVILGLVCSFIFFTLALTTIVQSLGISANLLRYFAIGIIGLFGIVALIPSWGDRFAAWTGGIANLGSDFQSKTRQVQSRGFWSGWLVGLALGLVWTPCAGPILAAITTLVATQHVTLEVFLLTLAYSLGAGLPLLLIAYGGNWVLRGSPTLIKHAETIRQLFGGIMVLTAVALLLHWDVLFQQKVLDYLPSLQIENTPWIQERLQQLRSTAHPGSPAAKALTRDTGKISAGQLPKIAPAPDFVGIEAWINSNPLTIKELKGKVVLVDFWTYSCINCIRTLPYLKSWDDLYRDKGFVIVGVHTPEFEFEKSLSNVEDAVKRFGIRYPVALDNHYATWQAYDNSYWPADYLVDQEGIIREVHFGEGAYGETENAIRSLLHMPPLKEKEKELVMAVAMTHETYLGFKRGQSYAEEIQLQPNQVQEYAFTKPLEADQIGLEGKWKVDGEQITSFSDEARLELNFMANQVYLVLGGQSAAPIRVELDGKPLPEKYWTHDMNAKGEIFVKEPRKYDIVNLHGEDGRHLLVLHIPKGVEAYAFTFGMEK